MGSHSLHANRMAATQSLPKVDKMQNLHSKGMFHPPFPNPKQKLGSAYVKSSCWPISSSDTNTAGCKS